LSYNVEDVVVGFDFLGLCEDLKGRWQRVFGHWFVDIEYDLLLPDLTIKLSDVIKIAHCLALINLRLMNGHATKQPVLILRRLHGPANSSATTRDLTDEPWGTDVSQWHYPSLSFLTL